MADPRFFNPTNLFVKDDEGRLCRVYRNCLKEECLVCVSEDAGATPLGVTETAVCFDDDTTGFEVIIRDLTTGDVTHRRLEDIDRNDVTADRTVVPCEC